ncbi:MAG TPA: hypothetical protein PKI31_02475, partial [Spirochaetota bacterium]|nr:hypothetical protein [Spirochaetota bacterium]
RVRARRRPAGKKDAHSVEFRFHNAALPLRKNNSALCIAKSGCQAHSPISAAAPRGFFVDYFDDNQ